MSNSQDIQLLTARFVARWAELRPSVPATYDNAPAQAMPVAPWVRFVVRPGASARESYAIDTTRFLQLGRVMIQVFVPRQSGTGLATQIADDAASIFRLWRSDAKDLRTLDPELSFWAANESDEFFMVSVSIPYESQHIY